MNNQNKSDNKNDRIELVLWKRGDKQVNKDLYIKPYYISGEPLTQAQVDYITGTLTAGGGLMAFPINKKSDGSLLGFKVFPVSKEKMDKEYAWKKNKKEEDLL